MGTVESTLMGETVPPPQENDLHKLDPTRAAHAHTGTRTRSTETETETTSSNSTRTGTRTRTRTTNNRPHPIPTRSTGTALSSNIKSSPQSKSTNATKAQMKILKGSVVGSTNVGKSSLLHRLRGGVEDTIIPTQKKTKRRMMALIPWSPSAPLPSSSSPSTDVDVDVDVDVMQLHIVERHEGDYAALKERDHALDFIIFMVDRTNSDSLDFVIEFLNGILEFHKVKVRAPIQNVDGDDDGGDDEDGEEEGDYASDLLARTLPSVCILLNHYDITASESEHKNWDKDDHHDANTKGGNHHEEQERKDKDAPDSKEISANTRSSTSTVTLEELNHIINTKITHRQSQSQSPDNTTSESEAQLRPTQSPPIKFDIKCIDACMKNGYGLQALNSFITLPYLQKKERDIRMELQRVGNDLKVWDESFDKDGGLVSFDELEALRVKSIETSSSAEKEDVPVPVPVKTNQPRNDDDDGRRRIMPITDKDAQTLKKGSAEDASTTSTKKKKKKVKSSSTKKKIPRSETSQNSDIRSAQTSEQKRAGVRPNQRMKSREVTRVKRRKPKVVYSDPKKALEAFLASDDESDNEVPQNNTPMDTVPNSYTHGMKRNQGQFRNTDVLDSDDSDDDFSDHGRGRGAVGHIHSREDARLSFAKKQEPGKTFNADSKEVQGAPAEASEDNSNKNRNEGRMEEKGSSVNCSLKAISTDGEESVPTSGDEKDSRVDAVSGESKISTEVQPMVSSPEDSQKSIIASAEDVPDKDIAVADKDETGEVSTDSIEISSSKDHGADALTDVNVTACEAEGTAPPTSQSIDLNDDLEENGRLNLPEIYKDESSSPDTTEMSAKLNVDAEEQEGSASEVDYNINSKSVLINESSRDLNTSTMEHKSGGEDGGTTDVVPGFLKSEPAEELDRDANTTNVQRRDLEIDEKNDHDKVNKSKPLPTLSTSLHHSDSDDDDECFMVTEQSDQISSQKSYRKRIGYGKAADVIDDSSHHKEVNLKEDSGGVSDAVRAAIAAAQQEAERMVQNESEKKSKKKSIKKSKKGDKKKKKKKASSNTDYTYT